MVQCAFSLPLHSPESFSLYSKHNVDAYASSPAFSFYNAIVSASSFSFFPSIYLICRRASLKCTSFVSSLFPRSISRHLVVVVSFFVSVDESLYSCPACHVACVLLSPSRLSAMHHLGLYETEFSRSSS